MNLIRVIPCLLLRNKGLVKSVKFSNHTYIGDPVNAVRIYNEMEADELILLDIDASRLSKSIDWEIIKDVADEAFMPVCYGGGIRSIDDAEKLFRIGIEKVSISTLASTNPSVLRKLSDTFGSQSVVVTLDVKNSLSGPVVMTHGGTRKSKISFFDSLQIAVDNGAGEIMVNHIDRDGMMNGYDNILLRSVTQFVNLPVIACGGCGTLHHMKDTIMQTGVTGLAAGSMFVYWGRLKGILINYPTRDTLKQIFH
jgi:cyclase